MKESKTYKPKSPDEIMCNVSSSQRNGTCLLRLVRKDSIRDEMCGYLDTQQRKATFTLHPDHLPRGDLKVQR